MIKTICRLFLNVCRRMLYRGKPSLHRCPSGRSSSATLHEASSSTWCWPINRPTWTCFSFPWPRSVNRSTASKTRQLETTDFAPRPVITPPAAPPNKIVCCQLWASRHRSGRGWQVVRRWPLPSIHWICTIMWKREVIHKTGSTQHNLLRFHERRIDPPPQTASIEILWNSNMCFWDTWADRQTDRHTDTLIALLCSPIPGSVWEYTF